MALCPRCGRGFKSQVGLGIHQARPGPCYDPEAKLQRARERQARHRQKPERRAAQRRALAEFRLRNPDYWKQWRVRHPESERARRQRWRTQNPELLRAQRQRRNERQHGDSTPIPPSHMGHELFEEAWQHLALLNIHRDDYLHSLHDPLWEDACSEAVLAILEGLDPIERVRDMIRRTKRILHMEMPLFSDD